MQISPPSSTFMSQPLRVSSLTSITSPLVYSYGEVVHSAHTSWP